MNVQLLEVVHEFKSNLTEGKIFGLYKIKINDGTDNIFSRNGNKITVLGHMLYKDELLKVREDTALAILDMLNSR